MDSFLIGKIVMCYIFGVLSLACFVLPSILHLSFRTRHYGILLGLAGGGLVYHIAKAVDVFYGSGYYIHRVADLILFVWVSTLLISAVFMLGVYQDVA